MKKLDRTVDINHEQQAIVDFVSKKWTPLNNLEEIVTAIKDAASHDARAWFDQYAVNDAARNLLKKREDQIEAISGDSSAHLYDNVCQFLSHVTFNTTYVRDGGLNIDGRWYFEDKTKPVLTKLLKKYPELEQAKPQGWKEFIKNYTDFDGQEEYNPREDHALFKGVDTASAGAPDFAVRIALPYVAYDDRCQGRKPPEVLVSSIYAHFLRVIEYTNSLSVCNALESLGLPTTDEMVFNLNVNTDNKLLKTIIALGDKLYTEADYLESVAAKKRFDALTPEEQENIRKENQLSINKMITEILNSDIDADNRINNKEKKAVELLREEFGA